jgi:hypothetical protein
LRNHTPSIQTPSQSARSLDPGIDPGAGGSSHRAGKYRYKRRCEPAGALIMHNDLALSYTPQLLECRGPLKQPLLRYARRRDHNLKSVRQVYLFLAQCLDALHNLLQINASVPVCVSAALPKLSAESSTYPPPRNAHHVSPRAYPATGTRSHALQRSLAWPWPVRLSNPVARTSVSGAAASSTSSGVCYSVKLEMCKLSLHTNHFQFFPSLSVKAGPPHCTATYRTVLYVPALRLLSLSLSHAEPRRLPLKVADQYHQRMYVRPAQARITRRYASCQSIWLSKSRKG